MPLRFARALLLLALLLTAVGIFVPFLPTFARDGLDESWMLGMNAALAQGLIPGRDIVFTLGPYAAIYTRNYHPGTDAGMLWGSLYLALSFAFLLHGLYRHTRWPLRVAILIVFAGLAYSRDALLLFVPLLAGAYTYRTAIQSRSTDSGERALLASLALAYAPFGLLVMIKGSMLVACVFTQLLSTALFVALKQHRAAVVVLLAPVLSAFAWVDTRRTACGHSAGLLHHHLPDHCGLWRSHGHERSARRGHSVRGAFRRPAGLSRDS